MRGHKIRLFYGCRGPEWVRGKPIGTESRPTGTSVASRRGEGGASDRPSARQPCPQVIQRHPGVAKGASDRSSARRPCPQVLQRHPGVAKGASDRSSARGPCLQASQWHPHVPNNPTISLKLASKRTSTGPATLPTGTSGASPRGKAFFWTVFGTATLPTDASVASSLSHCELVYR